MHVKQWSVRLYTILSVAITILCAITLPAGASVGVLTQNNDNGRDGANLGETALSPSTVNSSTFGLLFTRTLDANVNGQVLYVPNVTINGTVHNVIYCTTSNNSNGSPCGVWAFDADSASESTALWHDVLPTSGEWLTSAPVIDVSTDTLYACTKDTSDAGPIRLRAFDITTGKEKPGSGIKIYAAVKGTGDGSSGGIVSLDWSQANCRPALLFLNGDVYIAFAHNSDSFPYHGWVLGYHYDGTKFTRTAVLCTTAYGGLGGVWQAGKGLTADSNGNIYLAVGNGTFSANATTGPKSYGMCYLRLSTPSLTPHDYFSPYDEATQSNSDKDLGGAGLLLIPGTDRLFGGGTKFGSAFLLDSTNLGGFTAGGPDNCLDRINGLGSSVGQNAVCWDETTYKYVYLWSNSNNIQQFRYDPSVSTLNPAGIYLSSSGYTSGGSLGVSADASTNGILWAVGNNHVVYAFNATDVSKAPFWTSIQNSSRDKLPSVGHFQFPTIVNGKVYVPTGSATIAAYGLLSGS